jgi:type II secretory pathway pseudopilin PulG
LNALINGYPGIALIPMIGLMAAIALPNFVKARDTAQRNVCIHNLRVMDSAKDHGRSINSRREASR